MDRLRKKTAVITGGSSGIGLATAGLFLAEGARVIITGRSQPALDEAARTLGEGVFAIQSDAENLADIRALAGKISVISPAIDILFVNAGVTLLLLSSRLPKRSLMPTWM